MTKLICQRILKICQQISSVGEFQQLDVHLLLDWCKDTVIIIEQYTGFNS